MAGICVISEAIGTTADDSGPSCREDACDRVLAREVRRASSEKALVALERLGPALARRVDVDSLVARNEHELRRPVEVEAAGSSSFRLTSKAGSPDSGWGPRQALRQARSPAGGPLPPRLSRRGRSDRRSRSNRHGLHRSRSLRTAAARPRVSPPARGRTQSSRSRSGRAHPRGSGGSRRPRATDWHGRASGSAMP